MTPPAVPNPGTVARLILQDLQATDSTLTLRAIARRLGVDESLLYHWQTGARIMAVEWLPHLSRIYGAEAAYGELLARAGYAIVALPEGEPAGSRLERGLLVLGGAVGQVQAAVASARDASSDDGEAISDQERGRLLALLRTCAEQVAQLEADLGASGRARPGTRGNLPVRRRA